MTNIHTASAVFNGIHYLTVELTNVGQGSVTFIPYEQHSNIGEGFYPYFGTFVIRGPLDQFDPSNKIDAQILTFKSDNSYVFYKYSWGRVWNLTPSGVSVNWLDSASDPLVAEHWDKQKFYFTSIRSSTNQILGYFTMDFLHDGDPYDFAGYNYPPVYTHLGYDINGNVI